MNAATPIASVFATIASAAVESMLVEGMPVDRMPVDGTFVARTRRIP